MARSIGMEDLIKAVAEATRNYDRLQNEATALDQARSKKSKELNAAWSAKTDAECNLLKSARFYAKAHTDEGES